MKKKQKNKVCPNCDMKLPTDANYCLKCGAQQSGIGSPSPNSPMYDQCQLRILLVKEQTGFSNNGKIKLVARSIGPSGSRVVAETPAFTVGLEDYAEATDRFEPNEDNKRHRLAVESIINALVSDKWLPVKTGQRWWQNEFRRVATGFHSETKQN